MTVLAVIPARMGSARLPRKNVLEIEPGLSLVQQAVDCARWSGVVDQVVVSTDDTGIPVNGALVRCRPPEISGPTADICDAVRDAWVASGRSHDWIITLQPAVLARSPLIVRTLLAGCQERGCRGGVTVACTAPWHWRAAGGVAQLPWMGPGRRYPRSQDCGHAWAEVNAVQVAHRSAVELGRRWDLPLALAILPAWSVSLDVDWPSDLAAARRLWPWAKRELETWDPPIATIDKIIEGA
jgi:hypothetical protein